MREKKKEKYYLPLIKDNKGIIKRVEIKEGIRIED